MIGKSVSENLLEIANELFGEGCVKKMAPTASTNTLAFQIDDSKFSMLRLQVGQKHISQGMVFEITYIDEQTSVVLAKMI